MATNKSKKSTKKSKKRQRRKNIRIFLICLAAALIIAALVRLVWIETVHVKSDAMSPRFLSGDVVAVNKLIDVTKIGRGDTVCVTVEGQRLIRRVAGIEGDLIDVRDGVKYLVSSDGGEEIRLGEAPNLDYGTIPHGAYCLLNLFMEDEAPDSRGLGLVKRTSIIGEPASVLWPPSRMFR